MCNNAASKKYLFCSLITMIEGTRPDSLPLLLRYHLCRTDRFTDPGTQFAMVFNLLLLLGFASMQKVASVLQPCYYYNLIAIPAQGNGDGTLQWATQRDSLKNWQQHN